MILPPEVRQFLAIHSSRKHKVLILLCLLFMVIVICYFKSVYNSLLPDDREVLHLSFPETELSENDVPKQQSSSDLHVIQESHLGNKESPHPDKTTSIMAAGDKQFDVARVEKLFDSCRGEDDTIFLHCYIDAFDDLCKLFRMFGTIFGFVTSDVEDKTRILRAYHKEQPQHYSSIQSMLEFEVSNDLTINKKKPSGARTLLRLHRAMEFITAFLVKLKDPGNSAKFSSSVGEAYDSSLARYHAWLIRHAVHMALYMLPNRQDLLKKMGIEDNEANMQKMTVFISKLTAIYDIIQKLYEKDNLLDLP